MIKIRWFQSKNPNTPPVLQYKVWLRDTLNQNAKIGVDELSMGKGKWSIWMDVEIFYEE
jgi:hypothetical protein